MGEEGNEGGGEREVLVEYCMVWSELRYSSSGGRKSTGIIGEYKNLSLQM